MDTDKKQYTGGVSFLGTLTIVFIVLKLCKVISWSWIWVFAPLWMPWALVLAFLTTYLLFIFCKELIHKKTK